MHQLVVAACLLGVAACGNDEWDESLDKLEALNDRMCACKDVACMNKERDQLRVFLDKRRTTRKEGSKAQHRRNNALLQTINACERKLMSADLAQQGSHHLVKMKELADELCTCSDLPCAKTVEAKVNGLMTEMMTTTLKGDPGEQYLSELKGHEQKLGACLSKLKIAP